MAPTQGVGFAVMAGSLGAAGSVLGKVAFTDFGLEYVQVG